MAVGAHTASRVTGAEPLAVDLDALGDTRPLWTAWLESVAGVLAVAAPGDPG